MTMNRRDFLKAAGMAGCLSPFSGITRLAFGAETRDAPLLLTLFLRGGADGLHLVGPSADPDYVASRSPELRVLDSGDKTGLLLRNGLSADAGFRLHAEASPLFDLYTADRLAIIHAVGLTDGTRSHFVAQDLMERGLSDEKRMTSVDTGWLSRALPNSNGRIAAYSATGTPAYALHGTSDALSAPDISTGLGVPWGAQTAAFLRTTAAAGHSVTHRASLAALDVLETVDRDLPRDSAGKVIPYRPSGKANYEGAGDLSRTLASVARLARMDSGLTVACVDHGGWDTHEGQAGRFANQVRQLSTGLAAFHEDMASSGRRVVTLVMTEFGRRLRANKSGGTDHGHGSCWLVLGDGVRGGRMFGRWPGLSTPHLDQGVDLAVTTDYRQVLDETLTACGLKSKESLPGWKGGSTLGLFKD